MSHTAEAAEAFAQTKKRIAYKLKAAFVLQNRPNKSFLPFDKAKDIIFDPTLDDLRELCKNAGENCGEDDRDPSSVLSIPSTQERWMDHICLVLAVLLCIDQFSLVHWGQFRHFLNGPFKDLPWDSGYVYEVFDPELGQLFDDKQFAFCPVVLQGDKMNDYRGTRSKCKLPYLEEKEIARGSFGIVHKIRIHPRHLQGKHSHLTALARKDFILAERRGKSFTEEWETMQQILQANEQSPNIMTTCASLEMDSQLSIFYPLAKCNLAEYLKNENNVSDSFCRKLGLDAEMYTAKRELFNQTKGLAKALDILHRFEIQDGTYKSCFHMDLKPENILVCIEDNGSEVWKITDFGISRVKEIKPRKPDVRTAMNLNDLFVRRTDSSRESRQGTMPRGGGSYLAPEAMVSDSNVTNVCDVWSLACVVLLVMSFAHGGPEEVRSFQEGLLESGKGSDWFFVPKDSKKYSLSFKPRKTYKGQNPEGDSTVYMQNPMIEKSLIKWTSASQHSCKEFYRTLSKLLLNEALLPDPKKRINASTFFDSFKKYFETHFPQSYDGSTREGSHIFSALQSVPIAHAMLSSVMEPASVNFVAFVAPTEFHAYQDLPPHKGLLTQRRPPPKKYWSYCALSHDLLCIAINSKEKNFECQIVSLNMTTAEISQFQPIPGCIDLVRPTYGSIKMCAVSPDSMFLAFISEERNELDGFRIHLFVKDELCRAGASIESNKLRQNFERLECRRAVRLQFSPDSKFLCAVFVLQSQRRSGAKVLIWNVEKGQCIANRVISDTIGNVDPYGFVTSSHFVGQGHLLEPQVVLLTQGRYLNTIDTSSPGSLTRQDLGGAHRVIDFVIDESTGTVYYLAKVGGSNTTRVFHGPYLVCSRRERENEGVTSLDVSVPLGYDASTDCLCFRPGFWSDEDKFVAPKITIATVKGLLLTFPVPANY